MCTGSKSQITRPTARRLFKGWKLPSNIQPSPGTRTRHHEHFQECKMGPEPPAQPRDGPRTNLPALSLSAQTNCSRPKHWYYPAHARLHHHHSVNSPKNRSSSWSALLFSNCSWPSLQRNANLSIFPHFSIMQSLRCTQSGCLMWSSSL